MRNSQVSNRSKIYAIMLVLLLIDSESITSGRHFLIPSGLLSPGPRVSWEPASENIPRCLGDLITSGHFRTFIAWWPRHKWSWPGPHPPHCGHSDTDDLNTITRRVSQARNTTTVPQQPAVMEKYFYMSAICGVFLPRQKILYRPNNWCATGQFKHFRTARGYRWSFQK